jgi:hypothetical protein
LPIKPGGNSALEVKHALEELGFAVQSVRLAANEVGSLQTPSILWDPPDQIPGLKEEHPLGHFSVVRPLGQGVFQAIDFPIDPMTFTGDDWTKYLNDEKIADIVVLKCERAAKATTAPVGGSPQGSATQQGPWPATPPDAIISVDGQTRASIIGRVKKGDLAEGTLVHSIFRLKNRTARVITIDKIDWQCTCTNVTATARHLEPGQTCDFAMDVSLFGKFGDFQATAFARFTKDSELPPLYLTVEGTSHARWVADPDVIDLGRVDPTSPPAQRQTVLSPTNYSGGKPITRVLPKSPAISCTLGKPLPTGAMPVQVTFDPTQASGLFVG